jgi:hypothetical protein
MAQEDGLPAGVRYGRVHPASSKTLIPEVACGPGVCFACHPGPDSFKESMAASPGVFVNFVFLG